MPAILRCCRAATARRQVQSLCCRPSRLCGISARSRPNCRPAPGAWLDTAPVSPTDAAVAIGLGTWRFERYKSKKGKAGAKILWPQGADKARATAIIEAIFMARDLITTPSSDMGPAELAAAAQGSARRTRPESASSWATIS